MLQKDNSNSIGSTMWQKCDLMEDKLTNIETRNNECTVDFVAIIWGGVEKKLGKCISES